MNHIVVAGATGLIGQSLLQQLQANTCKKVTALSRRSINLPHTHQSVLVVDYNNIALEPALDDTATVICALGTTIKKAGSKEAFAAVDYEMVKALADQALAQGYQHFTVVSSLGADKPGHNFYLQTKHNMESALKQMPFKSLTIVRPSLLLGPRPEFRFGEKMGAAVSVIIAPLLVGKLKAYKPIQADQVAKAIILHSRSKRAGHYILTNQLLHKLSE